MKNRDKGSYLWKWCAQTAVILLCILCVWGAFVQAAQKNTVGIKKTLGVSTDGAGSSYLNYVSPVSGKEFRVSLHETEDGYMAYCLDRTKDSDYSEYNYNYEEVPNYSKAASDLQRNILLCGYPGNTVKELEQMYGYETNKRCAAQATQMAIWICNYMYDENVSMSNAWSAHKPKSTGDYKAVSLSKAILNRAYDMLNQSFKLSCSKSSETDSEVTYTFIIQTKGQYFPLKGELNGLPEGCVVKVDDCVTYAENGNITVNLVEGEAKISVTFSKYVDVAKVQLFLNGTVPVPTDYAGILYYENKDSSYQSVVVVKEAEPTYSEKSKSFSRNADQQMNICIKKEDSVGNGPQGEGTLVGAQYTIYDSKGTEKEVLTIGKDYQAVSSNLPVDIYTVKETKSPTGYNLDKTTYTVDGTKGDSNISILSYDVTSKEKVIEGKIRIVKTLENPDSGSDSKIPAKGVVFTYYLNSDPDKKMNIVLGEDGVGESDWMPYGEYTLEETEVPKGWKAVAPNTVKIEEEGKVLTYYMEDSIDASGCKIIKVDSETGKAIAFAGTRFQIRKKETDEVVVMYVEEQEKTRITEFLTNEEGYLVLPEKLQAGTYLLYELEAPDGYVKAEEPVEFTVPYLYEETVEVLMENTPVKCRLIVEKTGPVLKETECVKGEEDEVTKPVYEYMPLEGVEYTLTATEDIKTLDGTLRMEQGESITMVTGEDGKAVFENLYPGLYELTETKTKEGYVRDTEPKQIQLEAGGGTEKIWESTVSYVNYLEEEETEATEETTETTTEETTETTTEEAESTQTTVTETTEETRETAATERTTETTEKIVEKTKKVTAPKTEDTSELLLWGCCAILSGAVLLFYFLFRRKKSDKN